MSASRGLLGPSLVLTAAGLCACSSSGPDTPGTSATPAAVPTTARLPFHYEAVGESSSPTFHIDRDGQYTIAYTLKGSADQPGCIASIGLVAGDGSSRQVVSGQKLQPADSKQGSAPTALTIGDWRFQEGGGCSWSVTVSASG